MMAPALVVSSLAVAVSVAGCGSDKPSNPSSTTSSATSTTAPSSPSSASPSSAAGQPSDYNNLLIKPTDIVVAGDTFSLLTSSPLTNPGGVSGLFVNQGNTRSVDVGIFVYPDAVAAAQARDLTVTSLTDPDIGVKGGTLTPIDVGAGGTMAIGTTTKPDGPKSKASVIFAEGKTAVTINFESPANDPVPQDFVLDITRKQDAAIKAGLPS
jgi:hypothetical protein